MEGQFSGSENKDQGELVNWATSQIQSPALSPMTGKCDPLEEEPKNVLT